MVRQSHDGPTILTLKKRGTVNGPFVISVGQIKMKSESRCDEDSYLPITGQGLNHRATRRRFGEMVHIPVLRVTFVPRTAIYTR